MRKQCTGLLSTELSQVVIPAKAGIYAMKRACGVAWAPAFAEVTTEYAVVLMDPSFRVGV